LASKTSLANDCDASHIVSLRGSLKPISSVKWKKDSWMSHLFGTILRPSLTENFTDWWTSSLRDTLANRSLPQESEQVKMTQDTSGLGSQTEFAFFDQEPASSKMSKDIFRWDSPQSLAIWKSWVTRCRGEYSLRVKSVRPTSGSEFLSSGWPTPQTGEAKVCMTGTQNQRMLSHAVHGPAAPANPSTDGSRPELLWRTPSVAEEKNQNTSTQIYLQNQVGATPKAWATPRSGKTTDENPETWAARRAKGDVATMPLTAQVKCWATPKASDPQHSGPNMRDSAGNYALPAQVTKQWGTPAANDANKTPHCEVNSNQAGLAKSVGLELQKQWATPRNMTGGTSQNGVQHSDLNSQAGGKLNPRWVETLMGIPIGWTMPSCSRPVTIAPTNCDSWATESARQPQKELFEF